MRLLAEFKVDLLGDLDQRFKDVATTSALAALETRMAATIVAASARIDDHELRLQTLEQTDAADQALDVFRRWAVPVGIGILIAVAQQVQIG